MDLVRRSAAIGCTVNEIASVLGIARSTMYNHMESDPGIQEAIDAGRDSGCSTLRRLQWQGAEAGNATMLIWLGKQMLGQKDKTEFSGDALTPLRVVVEMLGDPAPVRAVNSEAPTRTLPPGTVDIVGR